MQASYWDEAVARSHGKEAAGLHCVRGREGGRERGMKDKKIRASGRRMEEEEDVCWLVGFDG